MVKLCDAPFECPLPVSARAWSPRPRAAGLRIARRRSVTTDAEAYPPDGSRFFGCTVRTRTTAPLRFISAGGGESRPWGHRASDWPANFEFDCEPDPSRNPYRHAARRPPTPLPRPQFGRRALVQGPCSPAKHAAEVGPMPVGLRNTPPHRIRRRAPQPRRIGRVRPSHGKASLSANCPRRRGFHPLAGPCPPRGRLRGWQRKSPRPPGACGAPACAAEIGCRRSPASRL